MIIDASDEVVDIVGSVTSLQSPTGAKLQIILDLSLSS